MTIEIVDLPSYIAWWIFPVRYVSHYQRVDHLFLWSMASIAFSVLIIHGGSFHRFFLTFVTEHTRDSCPMERTIVKKIDRQNGNLTFLYIYIYIYIYNGYMDNG